MLACLALAVVLVLIEILRSDDLSSGAKAAWAAALVVTNLFAITIYFAQGRTGKLGRIASYLLMLGLFGSMALVAAALLR